MTLFCLVLLCFRARLFIDALWSPAWKGLTSWLSFVMSKLSLPNWYPGSGVGLIVSIPDLCPLSYFHVLPRDNIRKLFTLCITQSLNSRIHVHLLYWIALFCIQMAKNLGVAFSLLFSI